MVEIVDGDEATRARRVADEPVVAAGAERRVVGGRDVEAPAVAEEVGERSDVELVRQRVHARRVSLSAVTR